LAIIGRSGSGRLVSILSNDSAAVVGAAGSVGVGVEFVWAELPNTAKTEAKRRMEHFIGISF
jgi:hypothetical protein